MKKAHLIFFLLATYAFQSQEKDLAQTISKETYAEKIYLQLSSTVFTTDEIIWFKAIVTQINNRPTKLSGILHVELIDFDKRIVDKKTLRLQEGISNSFFQLNEKYVSGRYLIRAYTEWNKNFDEDFIYKEYINLVTPKIASKDNDPIKNVVLTEINENEIELSSTVHPKLIDPKFRGKLKVFIDVDGKKDSILLKKNSKGVYNFNYTLSRKTTQAKLKIALEGIKLKNNKLGFVNSFTKTIVVDDEKLDLQFFPEGGDLVHGLTSKVAFKAINYKGKGIKVSGTIIDELGNKLIPFRGNHLGMGAFHIKGNINKTYYSEIINAKGVVYKYILPKALPTGYTIQVGQTSDYIHVNMITNIIKHDSVLVKIESKGESSYIKVKQKEGLSNIVIKKHDFPEGIIKISVLNKNQDIESERLVFNLKEHERIKLNVTANRNDYDQREKAILKINTQSENNEPLKSNTSVLVINKNQLGSIHNKRQNILSYFLLNSELKGAIESPKYYFDENNKMRQQDIDVLLLTQGWRSYKFSQTNINNKVFKIQPEINLRVSGTIGEFFNSKNKKKKDVQLTMMAFGEPATVFSEVVDTTGHFNFNLNDSFKDELEILIQTVGKKGKKKDYTININKKKPLKIEYKDLENIQVADTLIEYYKEKYIERKEAETAFEITKNTIQLDEVELTGYKLTPEREKMMELHGPPDVVIEDKELHKDIKSWSYGLFSVLMFSYPDDISVRRVGRNGGFLMAKTHNADFTFIIIDGIPVLWRDYPLIGNLPTEEIKSVEIVKQPKNSRKYESEVFGKPMTLNPLATISFINIYTYSKKGLFGVQRTKGIYKGTISGFSTPRAFYAPKYENASENDWKQPDLRSVVHWESSVVTDENGNAEVTFYNSDNTGEMLVIVESIFTDGRIGYKEITYTVEEKLEK